MQIALIRSQSRVYHDETHKSFEENKLAESLAIGYLDAYLKKNGPAHWQVELFNPVATQDDVISAAAKIEGCGPKVVGISIIFESQLPFAKVLATRLKASLPEVHIVVGGLFTTSAWQTLLSHPDFDSICRNEGEATFLALCSTLDAGNEWRGLAGLAYRNEAGIPVWSGHRKRLGDLSELPFPTRKYLPSLYPGNEIVMLEGSRGCNAGCTFCDARNTGWKPRPVGHLVDELAQLSGQYPDAQFYFVDNIFIGFGKGRLERARAFAQEILNRGLQVRFTIQDRAENMELETLTLMKAAGLNKVFLGIESFAETALHRWDKRTDVRDNFVAMENLKRTRIFTQIGFIGFDDGTTMEELRESVDGLCTIAEGNHWLHLYNFNQLIPYMGTHLEKLFMEKYGKKPDVTSANVWEEMPPQIRLFRDWVWNYTISTWQLTEYIHKGFDQLDLQREMPHFLETKNRLFTTFLDQALSATENGAGLAQMSLLCEQAVQDFQVKMPPLLTKVQNTKIRKSLLDSLKSVKFIAHAHN